MLAASICREVHFTVLSSTTMASRVPRCLFGKPNSRETAEMLQEALDAERSKFAKRWGVDPRSEDKENNYQRKHHDKHEPSPKKRSNPYSRQTSIHGKCLSRVIIHNAENMRCIQIRRAMSCDSAVLGKLVTRSWACTITGQRAD